MWDDEFVNQANDCWNQNHWNDVHFPAIHYNKAGDAKWKQKPIDSSLDCESLSEEQTNELDSERLQQLQQ